MIMPIGPVVLNGSSSSAVTTEQPSAASGPNRNPANVIKISFGSYLRKLITGILMSIMEINPMAESSARMTSFLVADVVCAGALTAVLFFIKSFLSERSLIGF